MFGARIPPRLVRIPGRVYKSNPPFMKCLLLDSSATLSVDLSPLLRSRSLLNSMVASGSQLHVIETDAGFWVGDIS